MLKQKRGLARRIITIKIEVLKYIEISCMGPTYCKIEIYLNESSICTNNTEVRTPIVLFA